MHLRRIELQGFKTFSRRTVVELPQGVTAVVGPNGSGKSNLADAIRWALGEQTLRTLRVRRSEEMIFGGTASRPRTGMAEVLLVFDNADAWLPTPYAEVVIGRRLFRSGDSEYTLNGARVRLRDIVDLMSAGGIGAGGASIVSQGQIDATLRQRPEERRSFLEEVAGIGRFQARRDQAERRLAGTRRNLERLRDLVAEIEPGLETLRRQAEIAEHGRELESELRAARIALLRHRLDAVGRQIAEAEEREQTVARRMAALTATPAAELRRQASAAELDAQSHDAKLRQCREDETAAAGALGALEARQHQLRERLVHLEARAADVPARAQALGARQAALEAESTQEERTYQELVQRVEGRAGRLERLDESLADARAAAAVRQAQASKLAELTARDAMVRERAEQLTKDQSRLLGEQASLAQAHQTAEQESAASARHVADARSRVEQAADDDRAAEAEAGVAHAAQQARADDLAAAERLLADRASRLDTLQAERRALQTARASQREPGPTDAALRERVPGVLGRLRELLPDALTRNEPLIDAALSDALNDWMIRDRADLSAAVAAIRALDLAPARLRLLESSAAPEVSDDMRADPNVLGSLDAYVNVGDDRLRRLLRRIVVVADLDAALRLRADHVANGPVPMIVALAGAAIDADGSIRIGATESTADPIAERLESLGDAIAQAGWDRDQSARALESTAEAARAATARADAARKARAECTAAHAAAREALTVAAVATERLSARATTLAERHADAAARLTALDAELKRLADERADVERALNALPAEAGSAARGPADLAALEREHAAATAEHRADTARVAELRARRVTRAALLQEVTAEREQVTALAEEIAATRTATRQECDAMGAEHDAAAAAAEAAREASRAAERQLLDVRLTAQRLHLQAAQRADEERRVGEDLTAAQRETERLAERQAELRRSACDDLGLADLTPKRLDEPLGRVERRAADLRRDLAELGPLNPLAPETYREQQARVDDARSQIADLEGAEANLRALTARLQRELHSQFVTTFDEINAHFSRLFRELFGGGSATMALTTPDDVETTGVEFHVKLPGRRKQELAALSGGERALVAAALIMALLHVRQSPFCVLDEVDAALDDANVARFCRQLHKLADRSQLLVITHNAITVESAAAIYGVTMHEDGVSDLLSLSLNGAVANGVNGHHAANGHQAANGRAATAKAPSLT
ncbi:MAG: chromosome segregation protein SMC [Chloroflexi bacterium]|nr:chromosome segregation protein SMC [Chloroflexota bacterium]